MSLLNILGYVMSLVYLSAGMFLLFGKNIFQLTDFQRIGLVIILTAYGLFRFFNTLKKQRESNATENENQSN